MSSCLKGMSNVFQATGDQGIDAKNSILKASECRRKLEPYQRLTFWTPEEKLGLENVRDEIVNSEAQGVQLCYTEGPDAKRKLTNFLNFE